MDARDKLSNARALELVATNCAVCGLRLRDSISVEAGIGPECRKKYGYNQSVSSKFRAEANTLIHAIAIGQIGLEVLRAADRLRMLGFIKLADTISARRAEVIITEEGGDIIVKAPYSEEAAVAFRTIPGRRWSQDEKVNRFPVSSKRELLAVLRVCYPGALAVGPKGSFVITSPSAPPTKSRGSGPR